MKVQRLALVAVTAAVVVGCGSAAPPPGPAASYDAKTGRLKTLSVDANHNGVQDTVSYMDGARILRIELDANEDGRVDRWDFYDADRHLEKVGFSRQNDGTMDAVAFYDESRTMTRMEISTRHDGVFDRIEFYAAGRLVRTAEDSNGDGRPDKWDEYALPSAAVANPTGSRDYEIVATSIDETGSGHPERRFVFGPGGSIQRIELDPDGDGRFVPLSSQ